MLNNLIWVAIGSALGGSLRYAITYGLIKLANPENQALVTKQAAYWAIVLINLTGCLLIGMMAAFASGHLARTFASDGPVWLLLAVGVLGGYTTFSAFGLHFIEMLQQNNYIAASIYIIVSVGGGLACAFGGFQLGKTITLL